MCRFDILVLYMKIIYRHISAKGDVSFLLNPSITFLLSFRFNLCCWIKFSESMPGMALIPPLWNQETFRKTLQGQLQEKKDKKKGRKKNSEK